MERLKAIIIILLVNPVDNQQYVLLLLKIPASSAL